MEEGLGDRKRGSDRRRLRIHEEGRREKAEAQTPDFCEGRGSGLQGRRVARVWRSPDRWASLLRACVARAGGGARGSRPTGFSTARGAGPGSRSALAAIAASGTAVRHVQALLVEKANARRRSGIARARSAVVTTRCGKLAGGAGEVA